MFLFKNSIICKFSINKLAATRRSTDSAEISSLISFEMIPGSQSRDR